MTPRRGCSVRMVTWVPVVLALGMDAAAGLCAHAHAIGLQRQPEPALSWRDALRQKPEWYGSDEVKRIAENVLLYQRANGGWPKNVDMAAALSAAERASVAAQKRRSDSTLDNGATCGQMTYLARVYGATRTGRYRDAFLKGLDYLLAAQYDNGGWPQNYPEPTGYHRHITYNDNAMIGVMTLLREIAESAPAYAFVDGQRRERATAAVRKGITCLLKTQIVVDGRRTVWCAQHDKRTLAPAPARAYEKASLSGAESVGIVRFLMGIKRPSPDVIAAVESAAAWFEQAKLTGIRLVQKPDPSLPRGYDRIVVQDPEAPPLWARFHEIGTNRPIFCGRDGVVKYSLAEIEHERRVGYAWYTDRPAELLSRDYPAWRARTR